MTIIDVNFRKEHAKIEVMRQDSPTAKPANRNLIRDVSLTFVEVNRMLGKQSRKTAPAIGRASNDNGSRR